MDTLEEICKLKKGHVEHKQIFLSFQDVKFRAEDSPLPTGFCAALERKKGPAIISEVKKASPSKGVIRKDFDPVAIAEIYQNNGASCLSVLTDEPYFQGHDDFLVAIKKAVDMPVLRKDFMIDPYQIYESRMLGADCILLIVAALDDHQLWEMYDIATELHMDVLVEVHNLEELERAVRLSPMMIGINNRNLKTLDVDINTSLDLLSHIPDSVMKISESGISSHDTIHKFHQLGYKGFLVGESLMREDDIGLALRTLLNEE